MEEPSAKDAEEKDLGIGNDLLEDDKVLDAAFLELAAQAARIEATAIDLDRQGKYDEAVESYREAADFLMQAATACPEARPDRAVLARHTGEIMGRVVYLQSLGGAPATAPVEQHIGLTKLSADGSIVEVEAETIAPEAGENSDSTGSEKKTSRVQQAMSAAAIGGAAGIMIAHGPITAVALAAGAAYATTRKDATGQAAREIGDVGLDAANRAKAFNKEHHVTKEVSRRMSGVVSKAKAIDEKYGVVEKTSSAATSSWETLSEIDRKHKVSRRLGKGVALATSHVASATAKVSGWLAKPSGSSSST